MGEDGDSSRPAAGYSRRAGSTLRDQRIEIDLVERGGDWSFLGQAEAAAQSVAREIAKEVDLPAEFVEVAVALCDDADVRALNQTFRGQDKATNVLSFPANTDDQPETGQPLFIGDIALAAETLVREAHELSIPPGHHFLHLTTHGILHTLGFDHETEEDAEAMESAETRILARLGVPDPYKISPDNIGDHAGPTRRTLQTSEK